MSDVDYDWPNGRYVRSHYHGLVYIPRHSSCSNTAVGVTEHDRRTATRADNPQSLMRRLIAKCRALAKKAKVNHG